MRIIDAIGVCICIATASPAAASKIFVIDQSVDLYPERFEREGARIDLGKAALSEIRSDDIVQGTVWFRRGHVRVYDPRNFTIYSWIEAPNATLRVGSKSMSLLNAAGEAFGTPFYGDALIVSAASRAAAGPFDVYGFRYRIAFDAVVSGGKAAAADFVLKPVIFNGGYAPGDILASAVPESSSWVMMALGFAGLGLAVRRRRADMSPAIA